MRVAGGSGDEAAAGVTRDDLRSLVFDDADTEVADTYVHYLSRKLGQDVIATVRGLGIRSARNEPAGGPARVAPLGVALTVVALSTTGVLVVLNHLNSTRADMISSVVGRADRRDTGPARELPGRGPDAVDSDRLRGADCGRHSRPGRVQGEHSALPVGWRDPGSG